MDFTREPIIETIITPKDGHKLVVRSSKTVGQEEYFVDALEIVSFGQALFFRSLERPKSFLVPVCDYEVLEVRETRMVLKNTALERSIKIGGGREASLKQTREAEKREPSIIGEGAEEEKEETAEIAAEARTEGKSDRKRDRRRNYRKRRGVRDEQSEEAEVAAQEGEKIDLPPPSEESQAPSEGLPPASVFSSLLQPPPTLISETISRYRENALFKDAFYEIGQEPIEPEEEAPEVEEEYPTQHEEYKPHDKVQDLLNEEDIGAYAIPPEPIFQQEGEATEPPANEDDGLLSLYAEEGDPTVPKDDE